MAFRLGRFEDAERYLERAVSIDDGRAEIHALRGLNLLRLNQVTAARASFEHAIEKKKDDPVANAGLAWCIYLEGDPGEALIRLANIEEQRRNQPPTDPWRVWAQQQQARLQEHLQKVEWRDTFERKSLANRWETNESDGVVANVLDGAAELKGVFDKKDGRGRIYRQYDGAEFVSFECDLWIDPQEDTASIGIFAARERVARNATEVFAAAAVSRHKEGNVQVLFKRQGQAEDLRDMRQPFPAGQWVRVKLERRGESSEATITLLMDGIPLVENQSMPALGQAKSGLFVGLFVE